MKNIYKLLLIAFAVLAGVSCKGSLDPQEPAAKAAEVIGSYLKIPAKGGESFIYIKSAETVKADALKDWVSISTSRSNDTTTVVASALANESFESRYSQVLVKAGDQTFEFTVQQLGFQTSDFEPSDININSDAASFDFPYTYDEEMIADVDVDWITLTVTKDNLHIEIAENTTDATKDNTERVGIIAWSLGHDGGLITVTQKNASFMKQDSNWTVTYDGRHNDEDGELADFITNTVAKAGVSGKYLLLYAPKDQVDEYGKMEDAVLDVLAPQAKEELDYIIMLIEALYGETLTYDDFLNEDTYTDIFNPIAAGKYYAFAIGLDSEDCMATGHYNYCEFEVKGGDDPTPPSGGYEDWLGEWLVPHGNGSKEDTWVFTEKVKGQSYYVTGIEGYTDLKIEVAYDAATKTITAYAQEEIGTKTLSAGECSVGFYGATSAGNFWTPGANPYVVFSGKMNGDTATISPEALSTQDGEVTPELAVYIATTPEGKYTLLKAFADATKIPNTMKRKGGDDPTPPSGGSYEDWLGTWLVPHGSAGSKNDKWVFTEKVKGQSYTVTGIEGYTDLAIEVVYDAASKGVIAYAQEEIGTKTLSAGECSVGFYGATAAGNFWTPGATPYTVFTGVMNGKTAVLSPEALSTQDGEVTPELAVYIATTPDGKYTLLKAFADATKIPVTITREDGGGDNPGGDDSDADAVLGKWICPSVSDYWGDPYTDWVFNIKKSGNNLSIEGFDVGFDDFLKKYSFKADPAPATYNASSKTLTVAANTPTGIASDDLPITWVGLDGDNYIVDIDFQVDAAKNTITLVTELFGAYIDDPENPGFYSLYEAPVVFYKEGHVPSSYAAPARNTVKKHEYKTLSSRKSFPMLSSVYGGVVMTPNRVVSPKNEVRMNAIQAESASRTIVTPKILRKIKK